MRKFYLDNIRWATVFLVMIYHVCFLYNGSGILGGIPNAASIPVFDAFACMVYPWFMALLFIVAGISARYSLQKRTNRQFLKERTQKLLIPSTLGLFVVHWITGYLNIRIGGGLSYIPPALVYPIAVLSGIGPLWFIQMLFLFSCMLIVLTRLDKKDKLWALCQKAGLPVILPLFLLLFGASRILNMPVLTMYAPGNTAIARQPSPAVLQKPASVFTFCIIPFCSAFAVFCTFTVISRRFGIISSLLSSSSF